MKLKKILVLGAGTVLLLLVVFISDAFRLVDSVFYDLNFVFSAKPAGDSVVVVAVDMKSISEVGAWPWPRSSMARLVEQIEACGPRAVALDFLFPKRQGDAENDSLAAVFGRMKNLVLPFRGAGISAKESARPPHVDPEIFKQRFVRLANAGKLDDGRTLFYTVTEFGSADPLFSQHGRYGGFLNVSTSSTSQKIREVIHVIRSGSEYYPSFGLSAVAAYLDVRPDEFILDGDGTVVLRDREVPLTSYAATSFLNFRQGASGIVQVSAVDVMSPGFDRSRLAGKLVFVGITDPAAGAADFFITPVRSQFPGVEIWATAALDILEKAWVTRGGGILEIVNWLLMLLVFPGMALLLPARRKIVPIAGGLAVFALSVAAGFVLFSAQNYFWNPAHHMYAWFFSLLWLAAGRADPTLVESAPLELEPLQQHNEDVLKQPAEDGFITELPSVVTAMHVAQKLSAISGAVDAQARQAETVLGTVIEEKAADIKIAAHGADTAPAGVTIAGEALESFRAMLDGRIVRLLGGGGMADVYLVWKPRMEVYRAVKVLKPGQASTLVSRFETEIRIFSKLNHPNIVHCYGAGEWHGLPCIEMEYVHGTSLENVIEKHGRLSAPQTMLIGILVARALHYAHNQVITIYGETHNGVIHRDLKPANIMLSRSGRIKLTDFGIARPSDVSLHTVDSGTVVGTLPYLAPEQLDGAGVSVKSDIYALGATLHELLSGRRAFPQTEVSALVKAKSMGTVESIRLSSDVPHGLGAILAKAMHTDPAQRHASGQALAADLEQCYRQMKAGARAYQHLRDIAASFWA